jgi:1-acyl-sn-glycerol-3-phosphate acyltransferase
MNILVTGVSGFVGKQLVSELLRINGEYIKNIYILLRSKKNQTPEQRMDIIKKSPCFKNIKNIDLDKLKYIEGDLLNMPIIEVTDDIKDILSTLHIVINSAASIKFNDEIKDALKINCHGASNFMHCIKDNCPNLIKYIQISTAYVNPIPPQDDENIKYLEEELINFPIDYQEIIDKIDNKSTKLDAINKFLNLSYPNTYCLTKALGEHSLYNISLSCGFKFIIIRPGIITPAAQFPFRGWSDSNAAYAGSALAVILGIVNNFPIKKGKKLNLIPVDFVSNSIIYNIANNENKFSIRYATMEHGNSMRVESAQDYLKPTAVMFGYDINSNVAHSGNTFFYKLSVLLQDRLPIEIMQMIYSIIGNVKEEQKMQMIKDNLLDFGDIFYPFASNNWYFKKTDKFLDKEFDFEYYHHYTLLYGILKYTLKINTDNVIFGGSLLKKTKFLKYNLDNIQNIGHLKLFVGNTLQLAFNQMFSEITVDIDSFINNNYKDKQLLICPSHRSYIDFLLINLFIAQYKTFNINLPTIAATSDFKNVFFIGKLFEYLGAFYVQRGSDELDKIELDNTINNLLNNNGNMLFYPEGTRSRSRISYPFKTGLLKAIQKTRKTVYILPITISYEKVVEQLDFKHELKTNNKPEILFSNLIKWSLKLKNKSVNLGKVHIKAGKLLEFNSESDIKDILKKTMRTLQLNTISTSYHYKIKNRIFSKDLDKLSVLNELNTDLLDNWILLNQWIHFYLDESQYDNPWIKKFIRKYNYLNKEDKTINETSKYYGDIYFSPILDDINNCLPYIYTNPKCTVNDIMKNINLILGNIVPIFILSEINHN